MLSRRKNPLDRPGPRKQLYCSPTSQAALRDAAAAEGITLRIVLDELLSDRDLVRAAAARALAKISAAGGVENGRLVTAEDSHGVMQGRALE